MQTTKLNLTIQFVPGKFWQVHLNRAEHCIPTTKNRRRQAIETVETEADPEGGARHLLPVRALQQRARLVCYRFTLPAAQFST
jgi:hypothetical protein